MDKDSLLTKLPDDLLEMIGKVHKKRPLPVETLKRMEAEGKEGTAIANYLYDIGQYGGSKRRKSKKSKSKRRKSNKKKSNKRKSNKRKSKFS